jgi:hypothetical protein
MTGKDQRSKPAWTQQSVVALIVVPFNASVDAVGTWADRITAAWRETVEGIIGVGLLLIEARRDLASERGAWGRLIGDNGQESQLPFGYRTAYRLIDIAENGRILTHASVLPPSWNTLHQLTRFSAEDFDAAIADGTICPDMTREDLRAFRRLRRDLLNKEHARTVKPQFVIHHCDIGSVGSDLLPDTSVDAIITDPPYPQKFLSTFSQLSAFADRTLNQAAGASSSSSGFCRQRRPVHQGAVYAAVSSRSRKVRSADCLIGAVLVPDRILSQPRSTPVAGGSSTTLFGVTTSRPVSYDDHKPSAVLSALCTSSQSVPSSETWNVIGAGSQAGGMAIRTI